MSEQYEIFDDRFNKLIKPGAQLEQLWTGGIWCEGPVYSKDGYVLWSDIPNNRLMRWSQAEGASVFRSPSNFCNGNTRDHEGRLITCEHGTRRVTRTEHDGSITVVADNYFGKRLNSPNDVVVKSDGTIWFTDPSYGILKGSKEGYESPYEVAGDFVYRFDPAAGELTCVVRDMPKPNGLAFSLDEKRLYIADTSQSHDPFGFHHVRVYDVVDGKTVTNGRVHCEISPGMPDGFRFNEDGYLFISSADSIQVYTEVGELLGKIMVPEKIANCCFGGPDNNQLFITASSSLYRIELSTQGAHPLQ